MSELTNGLPQVYRNYDLLFTPRLISQLRNLRGQEWDAIIDYLADLPGFQAWFAESSGSAQA